MRYHHFLKVSLLTVFCLAACSEAPQIEVGDINPSARSENTKKEIASESRQAVNTGQDIRPITEETFLSGDTYRREKYQDLDSNYISEAEVNELIVLQAKQSEHMTAYQKEMQKWRETDPGIRGKRPVWNGGLANQEDTERLLLLNHKVQLASLHKNYENLEAGILTEAEIEELIALEREQLESSFEYQRKWQDWNAQDPDMRGPQPEKNKNHFTQSLRQAELQDKIAAFHRANRLTQRVNRLNSSYNISLSDTDLKEYSRLQSEQQKIQNEFSQAMMKSQEALHALQNGNGQYSQEALLNAIPRHIIQRMAELNQRINAIEAPIIAAERADSIRSKLMKLSKDSGVTILSSEISETIALSAEKDEIQKRTQQAAYDKWLIEGGIVGAGQPLTNDVDYARIKQIDARIQEISAPMRAAKNAALEANNPALRRQRLARENRQRWAADWRDKQQSGEIPSDVPFRSPSYAELKDRVENFESKFEALAKEENYNATRDDIRRLEDINMQMLAIRKKVHELEISGSSKIKSQLGNKVDVFDVTAGMFKIGLLEQKQRRILAGLSQGIGTNLGAFQNQNGQTGTRQFNRGDFGTLGGGFSAARALRAEGIITNARKLGLEVSDTEAEELRKFERDLEDE